MSAHTATYQTTIGVPIIGQIAVRAVYDMGWRRSMLERVASLLALFGILIMVAFLTMEGRSPPWVTATLGVSAMISVLLIYGIPFESIKFGRLEIEFEDTE